MASYRKNTTPIEMKMKKTEHTVTYGIGRIVCTCGWQFAIAFNRSISPETVWKAYEKHMGDVFWGDKVDD